MMSTQPTVVVCLAAGALFGFVFGTSVGVPAGRHEAITEIARECGINGEADAGIVKIECRIKQHLWEANSYRPTTGEDGQQDGNPADDDREGV